MDATPLFTRYGNLPPPPARAELGRLQRLGGVSSLCTDEGAQTSSPSSPCPPRLSLRVCARVRASVCRFDCLLYNIFFFQCLWAMGLEVKHLLNCCQARKWVIKLPREKIDHSGVNAGEQG